jgi:hypothetical protein
MSTTSQTYRSPAVDTRSSLSQLPWQCVTYPAPYPAVGGGAVTTHDADHGFCSVCGAVWPCARARRDALAAQVDLDRPAVERMVA